MFETVQHSEQERVALLLYISSESLGFVHLNIFHALLSMKVGIGIVRSIWLPILWNSVIYNERFACGEGCKANGGALRGPLFKAQFAPDVCCIGCHVLEFA